MDEATETAEGPQKKKSVFSLGRIIPLGILVAGLTAFFALDLAQYISLNALKEHRELLQSWVTNYGAMSALVFAGIYALAVAFSIPGAVFITIAGGFMFGPYLGTVYVVIGATVGAVGVFLAAKYAVGDLLRAKAGPAIQRMEAGFRDNELSYLLILRLVPIFPFWLINLAPAFLGVSVRVFFAATFIGIIPGGFVFALVGAGLGSIFDRGETFSMSGILTPEIVAALVGLALLSVLPVAYKKFKSRSYIGS